MDLTSAELVEAYIRTCPFFTEPYAVTQLSGGLMNYVYRVSSPTHTYVLKHSIPHVAQYPAYKVDPTRLKNEYLILNYLSTTSMAKDAGILVPHVYYFDDTNCVLVMEDFGPDIINLEEYLKVHESKGIGKKLGNFIRDLNNSTKGLELEGFDNEVAFSLLEDAMYLPVGRRLASVCPDPDATVLQMFCRNYLTVYFRANVTHGYVMGDLWINSIYFKGDQLVLLDWELCCPASRCLDIGHFCNWLYLLCRDYKDDAKMVSRFHQVFSDFWDCFDKSENSDIHFAVDLLLEAETGPRWCHCERKDPFCPCFQNMKQTALSVIRGAASIESLFKDIESGILMSFE